MRPLFLLLLFLTILPPVSVRAETALFRQFVWGVSEEDVMKFETAVFYKKEGNSLFFLEEPDDFRRLITYDFKEGKLWRARYEYVDLHRPNAKDILDMFAGEEQGLKAKFGDPAQEEFLWKNKTYRDYPQFWGRALLNGDLRIYVRWNTPDTAIELQTYHDAQYYRMFYTMEALPPSKPPAIRPTL